jgi:hypothetical protein
MFTLVFHRSFFRRKLLLPLFFFLVGSVHPRDEVTGGWRKLHNEELCDLYSSPSIIRIIKSKRMRRAGHVARMGEKRNSYRLLVGKPEGKRPLGRPRRRWVDNFRDRLGRCGLDWSSLG